MAAPHVAGLAVNLIALEGMGTPAAVTARIRQLAVRGVKKLPRNTVDAITYNSARRAPRAADETPAQKEGAGNR